MKTKLLRLVIVLTITVTALFALGMTVAAETVGAFEVTGGTKDTDYTYEEGVLTIKKETPIKIANTDPNTPTADRIKVADGVDANITLAGVNIDGSLSDDEEDESAFRIAYNSTGNVTITLADGTTNTLKGGHMWAGLDKSGDGDGIGKLTIQGGPLGTGSLFATGGSEAAGIGGGFEMSGSNITISGGNVTATGDDGCAGIGGGLRGAGSKITISGGNVTAIGGYNAAGIGGCGSKNGSDITISGGTVIAIGGKGSGGTAIGGGYNGEGSNITIKNSIVYVTAVQGADPIGDGANSSNSLTDTPSITDAIIVDNTAQTVTVYGNVTLTENFKVTEGYTMTIPENSTVTVAEGTIFTNNGTVTNNGTIDNRGTVANSGAIDNKGKITGNAVVGAVNTYDFVITGGTEGEDYTYRGGVLTVLTDTPITIANIDPNTATTDRIEVEADKDANITLAGVNIDVSLLSPTAAFKIADNSTGNVTITLADGRTNTLKSGTGCAGLQKNGAFISETEGKLTIQGGDEGTGILNATGGENSAGIGGGYEGAGSNITISGGIVTATSGKSAAGIGGGDGGAGSDITISGGTVTATGGKSAAGIGGGDGGAGSDITINDGTVIATGGDNCAGIGGGYGGTGSNITISGGTVIAKGGDNGVGIGGGGYGGAGSNITISGGTVTATGGYHSAGIGGGEYGVGSDIIISGGTVTATGGDGGAGIGGGYDGAGADSGYESAGFKITISGGTVTAKGGDGGAGIGGGSYGNGSDITISGGSVKAVAGTDANAIGGGYGKDAVTPTDGNGNNVYLLEIENTENADIVINGKDYPDKHFDEAKIYAYLPAKTAQTPNEVAVGDETIEYCYDTVNEKWLRFVDAPEADTNEFTYDSTEQTYALTESEYYTISDNTTQTNAGDYTVTVTLNDGYIWSDGETAAKEYTFSIARAELTVTAENLTVKLGNPLPATLEYTVSGLKGADTEAVLDNANLSFGYENGATPSAIGEYAIVASGDTETTNYAITYVNGKLTITEKAVQTIAADDVTLTYGDTDGKITATTDGDGAISYEVATGTDVISVDENGNITVLKFGTATVTVKAAETFDYAEATTMVTVTVNKAAVTVTADDVTIYVGGTPEFTYTTKGLVNGEELKPTVTLDCDYDASTVGTYTITVTLGSTEDDCYTYTAVNGTLTIKRKSTGGGSGGYGGGGGGGYTPSRPSTPNNPEIGGKSTSWTTIADDISKLPIGSEVTIELNSNYGVPVEVIKAIADRDVKVTFIVDSTRSWYVDGAEIETLTAADLSILTIASLKTDGLRGDVGAKFRVDGTNIPTELVVALDKKYAGKFANLYKRDGDKLVFVDNVRVDVNGEVILPVSEQGDYVIMLCEFSDRKGDVSNDGMTNALDASAILKDIVELEDAANPVMLDYNGDGRVNALDASAILIDIVNGVI